MNKGIQNLAADIVYADEGQMIKSARDRNYSMVETEE